MNNVSEFDEFVSSLEKENSDFENAMPFDAFNAVFSEYAVKVLCRIADSLESINSKLNQIIDDGK